MVDVKTEPRAQTSGKAKAARVANLERIAKESAAPTVRVEPANDTLRRIMKHPNGMRFRATGSVEWPLDKFTKRRLADGSITRSREDGPERPQAPSSPPPAHR